MNKSKLVGALLLLVSIISPSCDSKPKPGPTQTAPTEQTPPEVAPAEKAKPQESLAKQTASEETPSEEAPKEEASIQEMPTEDGVTGEAPTEESTTEKSLTEEVASEQESPVDEVTQSKRELLHMLRKLKKSAIAQEDQEKAESLELEIQQVVSDLNEVETAQKSKQEALEESESVQITEINSEVIEQPSEPVATETREEKPTPVELPDSTPAPVEASPYEKDIARLVKLRDSEKSKAEAPIQKRFDFAAQQLLRKFTQAGNLDAAIKLKEVIGSPEAMANLAQEAGTIHEKELARLIAQRDREMATAMLPIQKRFDLGAQQLIRKATQTGDLESAIKLKALIEEAKNSGDSTPTEVAKIGFNSPRASSKGKECPEEDFEVSFHDEGDGWCSIGKYIGNSKRVIVPSRIQGKPVGVIGMRAFSGNLKIEEVVLPDTIGYLGAGAFHSCKNLSEIHLPQLLTKIEQFAFGWTAIKELNLPASLEFIGSIGRCLSMVKINVDPANPNYQSIDGVLYDKQVTTLLCVPSQLKMQKLKVPESVRTIAERSIWDSNLKSIQIPKDAQIDEKAIFGSANVIRY